MGVGWWTHLSNGFRMLSLSDSATERIAAAAGFLYAVFLLRFRLPVAKLLSRDENQERRSRRAIPVVATGAVIIASVVMVMSFKGG